METQPNQNQSRLPARAARFIVDHLVGNGSWGELGDRYGLAVGGYNYHEPTIKPPVRPVPTPQGPNGSNMHVRLRDPVGDAWELIEPREAA